MSQTCPFCGGSYPDNVAHACPGLAQILARNSMAQPRSKIRKADQYRSYYPGQKFGYLIIRNGNDLITCVVENWWSWRRLARYATVVGHGTFTVKREHHHKNTVVPRHPSTFRSFA